MKKKVLPPRKIPPLPKRHKMNKLEARYRDHLEELKRQGKILDYKFEALTFRLASRTTYTPDFIVICDDCIEVHEVKGFWKDDARVKWKVAAEMFPEYRFVAVQYKKKEWVYEVYENAEPGCATS